MNGVNVFNSIAKLDESVIDGALILKPEENVSEIFSSETTEKSFENVRKKKRVFCFLAAAICTAVLVSAIPLAFRFLKRDTISENGWVIERVTDTSIKKYKRITTCNMPLLSMNVGFMNVVKETEIGENSFDAKTDPGIEMFTIWMYSQFSFDYASHFSLYQRGFVDRNFTSAALKRGYDYDEALKRITEVSSRAFAITDINIKFEVDQIKDITDNFINDSENLGFGKTDVSFERVGLDLNKVKEVRRYFITNIVFTTNEIITGEFENVKFTIYKYDGNWYVYGLMEYDLSIDMLGKNADHYMTEEALFYGTVSDVGEHYVKFDDGLVLICLERQDVWIGETVRAVCAKAECKVSYHGNKTVFHSLYSIEQCSKEIYDDMKGGDATKKYYSEE